MLMEGVEQSYPALERLVYRPQKGLLLVVTNTWLLLAQNSQLHVYDEMFPMKLHIRPVGNFNQPEG